MRAGKRVPEQPDPKVHLELFSERFCHFFSFDHPTKLAVRLGQDWGSRPAQLPPDFSTPPMPGTGKTSGGGGPDSAGGADAVFACAAHRADSTQGGASVLHCYLLNVP